MPITIDVLTQLDERSLANAARSIESRLSEISGASGKGSKALEALQKAQDEAAKSAEALAAAQAKMAEATITHNAQYARQAGFHKQVRDAIAEHEQALQRLSNTQQQYFSSLATGAAKGLAAVTGVAAGTFAALAGIGEQFEGINRQIVTSTGAMGPAFDALNQSAKTVMASVDTSVKSIGSDLGVLANRLQLVGGDPALENLTKHVEELRDRFGGLDIRTLTGDFVQFGISGKQADDVLASLMNTAMATSVPLNELVTTTQQFGETLQQAGLNIEQSARLVGQMDTILGPGGATRSMTGFAKAEADAAKEGMTLQQFLVTAAGHIETFMRAGDQAEAQDLMQQIFGTRNWPQAQAILKSYTDILKEGGDAWKAQGSAIDDVAARTKTFGNYWDEVRNKISTALAPPGKTAIDVVGRNMERLVQWVDEHQNDLRNFFQNAVDVIGTVVSGLGEIAAFLGRHPALIYAVAGAFATWKTIEGIAAVVTALKTISGLLVAAPAEAAAAGAGIAAGLGTALAAALALETALATAAALFAQQGSAGPAGGSWGGQPAGPGQHAEERKARQEAGKAYAQAHGGKPLAGRAYGDWTDGKGPMPPEMAPYYHPPQSQAGTAKPSAPPGTPPSWSPGPGMPTYSWVPGQGYVPSPGVPVAPGGPITPGGDGSLGDAQSFLDSLTPGKDKGGKGSGPKIPFPAEYGQPPAPGESTQHWRDRMSIIEKQHDVAEAQAKVDQLEKDHTAKQDDIVKARNDLIKKQLEERESEMRLDGLGGKDGKSRIPYGPGFAVPPRPGESLQQYEAEGRLYEAHRKLAEAQDTLSKVEASGKATAEDLVKAHNDVAEAQRGEYTAQMQLNESLTKGSEKLDEFGAKIDQDFGVSKGLPGIAENIFKFLANLVAAPIMGAAQGFNDTQGGPTYGAKGLLGAAALGGAFGPQFTPQGIQSGLGSSGEGGFSISGLASGITSGISSPGDLVQAGGRVSALYGLAQQLSGTPYSQAIRNDCSGMVNELASAALGLPIPSAGERFNTTNEGQWLQSHGFQMGTPPPELANQSMQIGWNPAPGNAGHTAATLPGGVNAEQGGNNSVFTLGSGAAGANSPQFPLHAWLNMGTPGISVSGQPGTQQQTSAAPSAFTPGQGDIGGPGQDPKSAVHSAMLQAGYGEDQWEALNNIIARESSWNPAASNPQSGAYGLFQFLGHQSDKYGQMGAYSYDASSQAAAGLAYIRDRYGSPAAAWAHWQQNNSYDTGGEIVDNDLYDKLGIKQPHVTNPIDAAKALPSMLGGMYTDNPLSHNSHSTGKSSLIRAVMQDPALKLPGFAAGGDIKGQGAIPIMAHEGEHVLTKSDVQALGGHDGVYKMRASLHQSPTMQYLQDSASDKSGPQSPIPKESGPKLKPPGVNGASPTSIQSGPQPGPSVIGTMAPPTGYGAGFAITGGGLIGIAESLPATIASMAASAGSFGMAGGAESGGAVDQVMGGMPGGRTPAMPTPAPAPPPAAPPSLPGAMPGGAAPGGASVGGAQASGGSPSGSLTSAIIGIGIQEMNAAIGAGGQAVGAGVSGLLQTFGPSQFAQSKLAQSGWVPRILGGITGAQPQLPNMAGQKHTASSLTPEQAASAATSGDHIGGGGPAGPGGASAPYIGTGVHIENYNVSHTEDRAGADLSRQLYAHAASTNAMTGSR